MQNPEQFKKSISLSNDQTVRMGITLTNVIFNHLSNAVIVFDRLQDIIPSPKLEEQKQKVIEVQNEVLNLFNMMIDERETREEKINDRYLW
jgi:hypothetical protein